MINKELARVEKMLKIINQKEEVTLKDISNIKVEKFNNEAIITITNEDGNSEIFVVLRKNFEDRYSISWKEI